MPVTESQFQTIVDEFLEHLFDTLDEAIGGEADVDLEAGILNIELDDGGTYIINKHAPNKQIWMSSPKSGATHYDLVEETNRWIGTRDQADLHSRLADEIQQLTGIKVEL